MMRARRSTRTPHSENGTIWREAVLAIESLVNSSASTQLVHASAGVSSDANATTFILSRNNLRFLA